MLVAGRALVGNPDLMLLDEPAAPFMVHELDRVVNALKYCVSAARVMVRLGLATRRAWLISEPLYCIRSKGDFQAARQVADRVGLSSASRSQQAGGL